MKTSIASSLKNLCHSDDPAAAEHSYIDSLVLHSPLPSLDQTKEAWQACEQFVPTKIRNLGISNVTLPVLEELYNVAKIKPSVVQNRFYPDTQFDVPLRKFCREKGIVFQCFWLLTANSGASSSLIWQKPVGTLAIYADVAREVSLYCLVLGLNGIVVLNGTRSHMASDLEGFNKVRAWALENQTKWENLVESFKDLTGDNPSENEVEAASR